MAIEIYNPINTSEITPYPIVDEFITIAEEKFRNRQTGKLIAKLIGIIHDERHHNLKDKRNQTMKKLNQFSMDTTGNSLTRFVARLHSNPRENPESFVETLLTRMDYFSCEDKKQTVIQQEIIELKDLHTEDQTCMDKKYTRILGRPVRYQSVVNICNEGDRIGWQPSPR